MKWLDISPNSRLPIVIEMLRELSSAATPQDVLRIYSSGMSRLEGQGGFISLSCRDLKPGQYRITRLLNDDNLTDLYKTDSWSQPDTFEIHNGGLIGDIIATGKPAIIQDLYLKNDPVLGDRIAHYGSLFAMPMYDHGKPLNWALQLRRDPQYFDASQVEDDLLRGNLVGGTVRHVQTARELREARAQIDRELDRIADIQRGLLPARLPDIPGVEIAASYKTFDQAGGDMYDFYEQGSNKNLDGNFTFAGDITEDSRWGIVMADASGHGPAAAVVMAMTSALLWAYPGSVGEVAPVLEHVNRHLCARRIDQSFVTSFMSNYDPTTRILQYACAGHPPPLLRTTDPNDPDGNPTVKSLERVGGLPLGILDNETYDEAQIQLKPGDVLAIFTDGITEAFNPAGELLGDDGIVEALLTCDGHPDKVITRMNQILDDYQAGGRPQDDQTLVVMRVNR